MYGGLGRREKALQPTRKDEEAFSGEGGLEGTRAGQKGQHKPAEPDERALGPCSRGAADRCPWRPLAPEQGLERGRGCTHTRVRETTGAGAGARRRRLRGHVRRPAAILRRVANGCRPCPGKRWVLLGIGEA